jgi:PAS domain S-box-containing protein
MKNKTIIFWIVLIFLNCTLLAKDVVRIGLYENSPKIYTDKSGNVLGFWADITEYIAEKENWEIEWIHGDWEKCLNRLENNEIDIMVDVGLSPARAKRFIFSNETVLLSWSRIYSNKSVSINSILDLEGKKIAGLKGSVNLNGPQGLKDIVERFEVDCTIIEMSDYDKIFSALANEEIDAGITNKDFGKFHENNSKISTTPVIFQPVRLLFAFNKNSKLTSKLVKSIDQNIKSLKVNHKSILYKSMKKYLTESSKVAFIPNWLRYLIIIIAILLLILFVFNRILAIQIKRKTRELELDIIKRKKVEHTQKENSQKLSLMIDQSPVGVSTTNLKGEYLSANPAYCEMVGFSEDELLEKKFADHTHPDDIEENKLLNLDLLKQNIHSFDLEKRYIKKNGETIHAFLRSQIVIDENGEPLFELAICEDITKQKKVKTELLRSEMRMKAIYQDALDVIAVVDLKKGSIVDINKSVESILGYKREMLIGKPFNVLFAAETDKTREQLFKELRINGAVFESQNFKREDGSICPMDLSITKIPWSDTDAALVNLRDATERTNTEKIIQKDLKEKEVMLMEIHHRVKNNLQIISSMLKMQSVYIKDEKALEYFKDSQNRVKSMSLIHESLYQSEDLSKINLERYIRKLINQLIISFRDDNKNIKTILDIDDISFNINKTIPLGLLINEIVSNAFKYAFLNMTEGEISVFLKKKGESYTLTISDNGVSIPEDLDIENTNSLGLHLVNALISQLHGKLELNRKNGTSFEVEFNLEPEK